MIDEARRWPFKVVGLAFPISATFIFLMISSLLHMDSQSFLNYSIFELVGGALMNLCAAGIAHTPGFGGAGDWLYWNGLGFAFLATFACRLVLTEVLLHLDLGWLLSFNLSYRLTSLTPGSIFIFTDCQSFLNYSILGLVGVVLTDSLQLVQWENTELAKVSGWLIAIVALTNFYTAIIAGTTPGFGDSVYSFNSSAFPGMQVALLVIGFGVGLIAFFRMMAEVLLHLDLVLLPSDPITSLSTSGSSFIFTGCQFFLIIFTTLCSAGISD
jgi:hypothetical protein